MESRKITVIQTKTQTKSVIMSSATTLSELKNDFRANNIDYTDMAFYEGVSKTELKTDESYLPHDIPYKGTNTNELVIMLTNSNKKIKSGAMTRSEVFSTIKSMGLQSVCVKKFNKNFTQCKTDDLVNLISEYSKKETAEENIKELPKSTNEEVQTIKQETTKYETRIVEVVDTNVRKAFIELLNILKDNGFVDEYDAENLLKFIESKEEALVKKDDMKNNTDIESSYSEDDLSEMMSCMNLK